MNAIIGVDQVDSAGRKVDPYGVPCTASNGQCCGGALVLVDLVAA